MKTIAYISTVVLPLLLIAGQTNAVADGNEYSGKGFIEKALAEHGEKDFVRKQRSKAYSLAPGQRGKLVKGSYATLIRKTDSVCFTIDASRLKKGAYTVWFSVYNNPQSCLSPIGFGGAHCDETDFFNPMVDGTVMWVAASLVGDDGVSHVNACVQNYELSHEVLPFGVGEGMKDSVNSEIGVQLRYHGQGFYGNAALLGEQLNTVNGACDAAEASGYPCTDEHLFIFPYE
jgi:hypothetical protein